MSPTTEVMIPAMKMIFHIDTVSLPASIAYAGTGFSEGVRYMLEASPHAAYCMPLPEQAAPTTDTRELDHLLATYFGWWDVLVGNRKPV